MIKISIRETLKNQEQYSQNCTVIKHPRPFALWILISTQRVETSILQSIGSVFRLKVVQRAKSPTNNIGLSTQIMNMFYFHFLSQHRHSLCKCCPCCFRTSSLDFKGRLITTCSNVDDYVYRMENQDVKLFHFVLHVLFNSFIELFIPQFFLLDRVLLAFLYKLIFANHNFSCCK